jgi:hypothetical protein
MEKATEHLGIDRLVDARETSLKEIHKTAMRPHGKLWGMDVFSWSNPSAALVSNTLQTLPFPVIWVGNGLDIYQTLEADPNAVEKLNSVVIHDTPAFILETVWMNQLPLVIGLNTVEEAMKSIKPLKEAHTILLFSVSGENWKDEIVHFEAFMKLHQ